MILAQIQRAGELLPGWGIHPTLSKNIMQSKIKRYTKGESDAEGVVQENVYVSSSKCTIRT